MFTAYASYNITKIFVFDLFSRLNKLTKNLRSFLFLFSNHFFQIRKAFYSVAWYIFKNYTYFQKQKNYEKFVVKNKFVNRTKRVVIDI